VKSRWGRLAYRSSSGEHVGAMYLIGSEASFLQSTTVVSLVGHTSLDGMNELRAGGVVVGNVGCRKIVKIAKLDPINIDSVRPFAVRIL